MTEYVNELMDEYSEDESSVSTMMSSIFNHTIELTKLIVENDKSMTSQKQIYKAYRESFAEVLKMMQKMG